MVSWTKREKRSLSNLWVQMLRVILFGRLRRASSQKKRPSKRKKVYLNNCNYIHTTRYFIHFRHEAFAI